METPATEDQEDLRELPDVRRSYYTAFRELAGGKGGMGRTDIARDRRLGRDVAIKRITYPATKDSEIAAAFRRRFENEARLTARLEHPAIVAVHEAGRFDDGEPFYAMPLVRGEPLALQIAACGSLEARLGLLPKMTTVCEAIAFAHSKGIVHRDIKPQNILVGPFGETVIIDWGLARDLSEVVKTAGGSEGVYREVAGDGLTQFGAGTPEYMSLEQASGEPATTSMDIYSLGASLYHVLAGQPPYAAAGDDARRDLHIGPPKPLREIAPEIPDELVDIVERAMARTAGDRFGTALDLAEELRRFQTGQLLRSRTYSTRELVRHWLRKHRILVRAVAATLCVLAVVGTFSIRRIIIERRRASASAQAAQAAASKLRLVQAQRSLDTDPTESIAWLKTLDPGSAEARSVRLVAADAESRGVAGEVYRPFPGGIAAPSMSPSGRFLAAADLEGVIWLWDRANKRSRLLRGHTEGIELIRFSRDNKRIVSAGADRTIRAWDTESGEPTLVHTADREVLFSLSPTGQELVFATDDDLVLLDMATRRTELLDRQPNDMFYAEYAPDGQRLLQVLVRKDEAYSPVLGGYQFTGEVILRDLASRTSQKLNTTPIGFVMGAEVSPDGTLVAAISDDHLRVWDAQNGTLLQSIPFASPRVMHFSPDGRALAVSSGVQNIVRIWSCNDWTYRDLRGQGGFVNHIVYSPDGTQLASSSQDGTHWIWNVTTGTQAAVTRQGPKGWEWAAFGADGTLATAGENTLRVWNLSALGDREIHSTRNASDETDAVYGSKRVTTVAVSHDNRYVASGGVDGAVWLVTLRDGAKVRLPLAGGQISALAFSPDDKWLAVARVGAPFTLWSLSGERSQLEIGDDAQLVAFASNGSTMATAGSKETRLWDSRTGKTLWTHAHRSPVASLALTADGRRLLVAAKDDGEAVFFDLESRQERAFVTGARNTAVALSVDGALAAVAFDASLRLYDLLAGTHRELPADMNINSTLQFSPQNGTLASSSNGHIFLWDTASGESRSFRVSSNFLNSIAFSPDGERLAVAGFDKEAYVCELDIEQCRHLRGHQDGVTKIVFSADGTFLVSASRDGSVRRWRDDLPTKQDELRRWLLNRTTLTIEGDQSPVR